MTQLPKIEFRSKTLRCQTTVVPVFSGGASAANTAGNAHGNVKEKPLIPKGAMGAWVQRLHREVQFAAALKSCRFIRNGGTKKTHLLMVGLGSIKSRNFEESGRLAGASVWKKLLEEQSQDAMVDFDSVFELAQWQDREEDVSALFRGFAEGLMLASYQFSKHKTASSKNPLTGPEKIFLVATHKKHTKLFSDLLEQARKTAEAIFLVRDWSNEPPNIGNPTYFASEARKVSQKLGIRCRILGDAALKKEKMNLILAVGQGSVRESQVVVAEYTPKGIKKFRTVCLVGKGVTFDTGGISLKPALRMEEMKHDMTGAATVFGATVLAATLKLPIRVIAILGFVENMPDGNAITPGHVAQARNGKTVEINNTDAEGRLVLADLLDYAHDFKPDAIINAATLTGAIGVALGKFTCGLMGNDEALIQQIQKASALTGERVWPLPLYDEYLEDLKSETADIRNVGADPLGGSIRGGIFLKQFVRSSMPWAHLDIAYTATDQGYLPYHPARGASGAHVRMLTNFLNDFSKD